MYEVGDAAEQMVNFPKMLKEGKSKIANFGESLNEETIQEFRDFMYELGVMLPNRSVNFTYHFERRRNTYRQNLEHS